MKRPTLHVGSRQGQLPAYARDRGHTDGVGAGSGLAHAVPEPRSITGPAAYRLETPRASFLSFFLFSPRAPVRFALGAAFLRAVRFSFLRSSLSSTLVVSATCNLFRCNLFRVSRKSGKCNHYVNRDCGGAKAAYKLPRGPNNRHLTCFQGTIELDRRIQPARLRPSYRF